MKGAVLFGQNDRVSVLALGSSVPVDPTADLAYGSEVSVFVDEGAFLDMDQTEFVKARCEPASMPRAPARQGAQYATSGLQRKQALSDHKRAVPTLKRLRCEQNTFSHSMYRRAHCDSTSHCTHSLYHICGSRLFGLCAQNSVCSSHLSCAMCHAMHSTLSTSSSTSPTFTGLQRLITSRIPCADPLEPGGDGFTDPEPRTSCEPNRTVDNPTITEQEIAHSTEESQVTEIEDKGKDLICNTFSLPYNQPLLSSTQDSIESIGTLQETDLDDEQLRALLASPLFLQKREASAERSQVYHSERESLM